MSLTKRRTYKIMMNTKYFYIIATLLAIFTTAKAENQSRSNNDTAETTTLINTTKHWSPSLVAAPNPVEEGIIHSERNRDSPMSNFGNAEASEDNNSATQQPDDENSNGDPNQEGDGVPGQEAENEMQEDIINMEQNRELNLNENMDTLPFQEPDFGSQPNSSSLDSPVEEGILGAERDRDETLTDMFQSGGPDEQMMDQSSLDDNDNDGEFEGPRFAFLIGAAPVHLSTLKLPDASIISSTRKPFIPPKSAWPVPQAQFLTTEPKYNSTLATPFKKVKSPSGDVVKDEDYAELVEVAKNSSVDSNSVVNKTASVPRGFGNGTEHYVENDSPDSSFTDLQTLFLACFATLVPLFIALMLACGLRLVWRRYRRGTRHGYGGGLRSSADGGSSDPITEKEHANDLKSVESGFSKKDGESKELTGNRTSPSQNQPANGSIITMTLKNNHLIVETEVRDDIIQGPRETKMKYSTNNDGVFVVEVQQSNSHPVGRGSPERRALVHHSPITNMPNSIGEESQESLDSIQPPPPKERYGSINTGLSTSDLSLSSSGSHNPSYAYGNQVGYEQGQYGYSVYCGYVPPPVSSIPCESSREPLITKTPTDNDKPVVTAAIFKQDSIIGPDDVRPGEYNIEGSTDGPLLSDIQARELSLHKLQDKIEGGHKTRIIANSDSVPTSDTEDDSAKQIANGNVQKEQTVVEINHDKSSQSLHRADSLPPRLIHEQNIDSTTSNPEDNFDIIEEEPVLDCYPGDIASGSPLLCHSAGIAAANARHKRASLPIITPDLYTTIKQTTKSMLPTLSPKFEKLSNENSPLENCDRQVSPLITVTEEADGAETDGNDSVQD